MVNNVNAHKNIVNQKEIIFITNSFLEKYLYVKTYTHKVILCKEVLFDCLVFGTIKIIVNHRNLSPERCLKIKGDYYITLPTEKGEETTHLKLYIN